MKSFVVFFSIVSLSFGIVQDSFKKSNKRRTNVREKSPFPYLQARLKTFQYCSSKNYPIEEHIVHTEDGYNLLFYRIQAKNTSITQRIPIFLQHGLVDSSDTWIVNDENLAPAFFFANQGFDVWMGNSRGNRYSSPQLSPKIKHFWNFSFDEMAKYDIPAALKYIYSITNRQIHYVGHSQGTLIMFIALAEKYPNVEEFLASFMAFGPVTYCKSI